MQAQITQAVEQDSRQLNVLMNASQGSAGELSAVQAGNQITALSAKQSMQMQTLMAAQYRAEAIERSRALYAEQAGAARHEAFILSSILSIGTELGTDAEDRIAEAIRSGGQDTFNQAGQRVVTRALSRKPTLRVRPGWRLGVIVNRDLVLSPYNSTAGGL